MPKMRGMKTPDGTPVFDVFASDHEGCVFLSISRNMNGLHSPMTSGQALHLAELIRAEADSLASEEAD